MMTPKQLDETLQILILILTCVGLTGISMGTGFPQVPQYIIAGYGILLCAQPCWIAAAIRARPRQWGVIAVALYLSLVYLNGLLKMVIP